MRVLILGDRFAAAAQRQVLEQLLSQLDARRIQAVIAALRAESDVLIDATLGSRRAFSFSGAQRLIGLLRKLQIELLHVAESSAMPTGILGALYADIPVSVVCERALLPTESTRLAYTLRRVGWWLVRRFVQRILVPSELVRRNLNALAGVPLEQISVVYPVYTFPIVESVDRTALGLTQSKNVALIAPEHYDAGYLVAIEVLERLLRRSVDARLIVIGDGAVFRALHKAAAGLALPIRWFPDRADLPHLLAACDAVLDCTTQERLPEGLLAAMLAGKPIVAPRMAGITEVLEPNVSALIVTPGDVSDMALQLNRVLQYESLATRLGRSAYKRAAERFAPEAYARAMTEFFETTIYSTR
ncbi:MAG: glycosyltransferase family 4 protein [Aggregatilineales bacterium]